MSLPGPSINPSPYDISLKKIESLPPEIQLSMMKPKDLVGEILDIRRPESRTVEAGKQVLRVKLLQKHLAHMVDEQKNKLLQQGIKKNHFVFFTFLYAKTQNPDHAALIRTAAGERSDRIFQFLLENLKTPLPPQSLDETLQHIANLGEPRKLGQLLAKHPPNILPEERLKALRTHALFRQAPIRELLEAPGGVFGAILSRHADPLFALFAQGSRLR